LGGGFAEEIKCYSTVIDLIKEGLEVTESGKVGVLRSH